MWRAMLDLAKPVQMRLGPNGGMLDQDQLGQYVRHMSPVHYEAQVDGVQDGGCCQDVRLVSSYDTTAAEAKISGD